MQNHEIRFFALEASADLGDAVARRLGEPRARHEERRFEDGEHKARPMVRLQGADVFVLHSLYGNDGQSVNDKLCRLLFFLGAVRDAGADRVTAVVPYLCYARKDRRTKSRDPVTTRYVAALFEAVDIDRIVTVDVHNLAAYENAFRCRTEHLEARKLFASHFASRLDDQDAVVVSPDVGGIKRADRFRDTLALHLGRPVETAFMEKQRSGGVVSGDRLVGEVAGRSVILLDDLISTGTTLSRAALACRQAGAARVFAAAVHGLFLGEAANTLAHAQLDELVVTNTVPPFRLEGTPLGASLTVLDIAPLLAEAIRRLHTGGSLAELVWD